MLTQTAPETHYLEVAGGRIAYDDTGNAGQVVLCVPGLGDMRASFRFLRPFLVAAGYRVVTMDLRGHGESSVGWSDYSSVAIGNDVLALLHRLNVGPAILVGNSYGGAAIACAAATEPDAVSGLIMLDAVVHSPPLSFFMRLGEWAVIRLGASGWLSYYKTLYKSAKPPDFDAYCTALKANLRERGRYEATAAMIHSSQDAAEALLAEVRAPVLIAMGTKDSDFPDPAGEAQFIAQKLARAAWKDIHMIEGAGHYPHVEMPEKTQAVISPFLRRLDEESKHGA